MPKYIKTDAIVDKVCEGISCNECSFGTNEDGMSECVLQKRIDGLPTADVPQWIPCSDRLPQENGRYLVTRGLNACGSLWNRVYIVNYSDLMGLKKEKIWWDGNVGKSDFQTYEDVLAWMPLPQPWKGEVDDTQD